MAEFVCDWGDGLFVLSANYDLALDAVNNQINTICKELGTTNYAIVLSGTKNFRKDLTGTYKANRKAARKPIVLSKLRDYFIHERAEITRYKDALEADDYLGILATRPGNNVETIIVSSDKDFLTIPGKIYRKGQVIEVSEEEAHRNWMIQTLTGDSTDGYSGCPGVGPKKAEEIIKRARGDLWKAVKGAFIKAGLTEDDAILQARLARILHWEDWDMEKQEVKLWKPE